MRFICEIIFSSLFNILFKIHNLKFSFTIAEKNYCIKYDRWLILGTTLQKGSVAPLLYHKISYYVYCANN